MFKTDEFDIAARYSKISEAVGNNPRASTALSPEEDADDIVQRAAPLVKELNKDGTDEGEELDSDELFADSEIGDVEQYEDTDLPVFNYKTLHFYMSTAYSTKESLLVYGDPGLGKSTIVLNFCQQTARSKGRKFLNWFRSSPQEQIEAIKNPSKYFTIIDVRAAQLEPTDFQGIPDIASSQEFLETKQPKWIYFMGQPEADGVLFLDELNQGHEQVLKALYEVVLDRSAGGRKFSDNFGIMAAGNLGSEFGNDPIPMALTNRFSAGVLVADWESWIDYAEKTGVDKRIISFVISDPSENFYAKPKGTSDPFPTPRQLIRLSNAMDELYKTYREARLKGEVPPVPLMKAVADQSAMKCGTYWAKKFTTFLKHIQSFNIKNIIAGSGTIGKEQKDKLHALVVFLGAKIKAAATHAHKTKSKDLPEEDQEVFEAVARVTTALSKEWRLILWNQLKRELPFELFSAMIEYSVGGKYNAEAKKDFLEKAIPQLKELLKK